MYIKDCDYEILFTRTIPTNVVSDKKPRLDTHMNRKSFEMLSSWFSCIEHTISSCSEVGAAQHTSIMMAIS